MSTEALLTQAAAKAITETRFTCEKFQKLKPMKIVIASVISVGSVCASAQLTTISDFATVNPIVDQSSAINGTWHGDISVHPSFTDVGDNGLATDTGRAFSAVFTPLNLGSAVTVNLIFSEFAGAPNQPLNIILLDNSGGSSSFAYSPGVGYTFGTITEITGDRTSFVGNLDWTKVDQLEVSGANVGNLLHAQLISLQASAVPEPKEWATLTGLGLLAFAGLRKRLGFSCPLDS
jgi:hypothetical protein